MSDNGAGQNAENDSTGDESSTETASSPSIFGYVRQLTEETPNFVSNMFGASLYEAVRDVADTIDDAFAEFVKEPLHGVHEANRARAMDNPIYRDIEERRRGEGKGHVVAMSEELGLGMDEWRLQDDIMDEVRVNPWWYDLAINLNQAPTQRIVNTVWGWYQRAARGWSDSDAWNLDVHMSRTLGEQLNYLADIAHGWPASEEYPTFEDWTKALRENAALLLAYVEDKTGEWTGADDGLSLKERMQKEDDLAAGAQRAYAWVGRNFQALWD